MWVALVPENGFGNKAKPKNEHSALKKPNYANPPTFYLATVSVHWLTFQSQRERHRGDLYSSELAVEGHVESTVEELSQLN